MVELPDDIPPSWITQLKKELKPYAITTLIVALLGSSVIAAVFTEIGNVYLESTKAKYAADVERYKACLDINKENLRAKRALYSTLAEKYRQLQVDFDDCISTCQAAIAHPKDHTMLKYAYDSLDGVTKRLVETQASARDVQIDQELRGKLTTLNDLLGPKLSDVSDDAKKTPRVEKLPDFVRTCQDTIRPQVDDTNNQIQLAIKSLKIEPCN
jgi:hypothetical protein